MNIYDFHHHPVIHLSHLQFHTPKPWPGVPAKARIGQARGRAVRHVWGLRGKGQVLEPCKFPAASGLVVFVARTWPILMGKLDEE